MAIEPSPGIADNSAPTTRRIDGTMVTMRITRNTRKARRMLNGPLAGTRAMATTLKSNRLQGSRKNAARWT